MIKIIGRVFPFLFRNRVDISLENKLTNILMFIGAIICIIGFTLNYLNGFSLQQNWMIGLGGIAYSVLFYYSSYKNFTKQLEVPFQIVSVLLLIYSWQTTDGIHGSTTNFFYIVTFALIYCSSKKKYWITFGFLTSISVLLVLGQLYLPSLIIPYSDNKTQINDITSGFVLAVFTFGIFTILVKKSFDSERLKSEQRSKELTLSEKRFKDIAIISADWIWEIDEHGIYTYCSEKAEEILGYTQNEIIGKYFIDLILVEELKNDTFINILVNRKAFKDLENWNLTKSKKKICLLSNGVPIFDEHNNFKGYRGVNKDITKRYYEETARKKAEESLKESQQIIEDIINTITVRVFWKDINLTYLGCNNAFAEDAGFTEPKDIIGKNDYQLGWAKQADLYRSDDMLVIDSGNPKLNIEEPQTTPEGKTITLITNKIPLFNSEGEIYGVLGTYIDITERKETEIEIIKAKEKAEASEEKYRLLYEFNPMPMSIFDIETLAFLSVNKAFVDKYGFSSDEFLKMTILDIRPESEIERLKKSVGLPDNGVTNAGVFIHKKKNGELMNVEIIRHEIVFNNKKAKLVLINDVTDKIKAENALLSLNEELRVAKEKAEESDMLKSAFLANMSHEIRTPLNSIVGFSKIIAKKGAGCVDNPEEMASIIDFNSNVLIQIIDDIIDLSKIESGVINIYKEPVDIDELLTNLLSVNEMTKKNLKRDNLELKYNRSDVKGSVIADKIRLGQILNNLISNALKYTERGKVEFGCDIIENNTIRFYVKDSGIGIPEEDASMIFTRFYKASNEITTFRGIGLGLPITKQLVEKMDGNIWFESQEDKGTTFYFTLPYNKSDKVSLQKISIKNTSDLKDKIILIADDDDGNFLLAKMLLNECGATVIRAENGQEAVQKCKEDTTINLVLMDMKMPIMDGMEATRLIKKFRSDLIIIALSANVFDEAKQTALNAGCNYFISKPINEKELIELLQN